MENLYLGIEIGATKQQVAVGKADGTLLHTIQEKISLKRGAPDILEWLEKKVPIICGASPSRIEGIAAGFGGPIESQSGCVVSSIQVPGWEGFKLKEWLEATFERPAAVINDTVAGGFAELYLGKGKKANNLFYTNIGSGIGGAFFINRQYYDGIGWGAGYLGNSYIPDWRAGGKGGAAKVELLCSGLGIESRLHEQGYIPHNSIIMELCAGNCAKATCKMLEDAAIASDAFSLQEIDRIAYSFSLGLCNVLTLMAPELIVIGGGVAKMGDLLLNPIRQYVKELSFIANRGHFQIEQSQLLDDAVIAGAVLCAAQQSVMR